MFFLEQEHACILKYIFKSACSKDTFFFLSNASVMNSKPHFSYPKKQVLRERKNVPCLLEQVSEGTSSSAHFWSAHHVRLEGKPPTELISEKLLVRITMPVYASWCECLPSRECWPFWGFFPSSVPCMRTSLELQCGALTKVATMADRFLFGPSTNWGAVRIKLNVSIVGSIMPIMWDSHMCWAVSIYLCGFFRQPNNFQKLACLLHVLSTSLDQ